MREIDRRLAHWRNSIRGLFKGREDALDELEDHLYDSVYSLMDVGMEPDEAFRISEARLGAPALLAAEFSKTSLYAPWLPIRLVWLSGAVTVIIFAKSAFPKLLNGGVNALLAVHMTSVTLGYLTTAAIGLLAACFFISRLFTGLDTGQFRSLNRNTLVLSSLATVLTGCGMLLGYFCPFPKHGQFWGWSAHEVGGVLILGWDLSLTLLMLAWHRQTRTVPAVMLGGLLGNVIILLFWLGAMSFEGHAHSMSSAFIVSLLLLQIPIACSAVVPAGALRRLLHRSH